LNKLVLLLLIILISTAHVKRLIQFEKNLM